MRSIKSGLCRLFLGACCASLLSLGCTEDAPPQQTPQQMSGGVNFFGAGTPRIVVSNGPDNAGAPSSDLRGGGTSVAHPAVGDPAQLPAFAGAPSSAAPTAPARQAAPRLASPAAAPVNIPKDAQYTITCAAFNDANSLAEANALKGRLADLTHMRDWYTTSDEKGVTTLYYGYYRDDAPAAKDGSRAHADLKRIQDITAADGDHPFKLAILVRIPQPDPVAPAEWDLDKQYDPRFLNEHYWSLQIAAFSDRPDRKQLAVDAVREFRKKGIEAYYYQGASISSVCIGLWPRQAVAEPSSNKRVAGNENANEPVFVSNVAFPKGVADNMHMADGTPVSAYTVQVEVADPTLKKMIQQYPTNAVNGVEAHEVVDPKTHQKKIIAQPSLLVIVPHADEDIAPAAQTGIAPPVIPGADLGADTFVPPVEPAPRPGAGQLPGLR